MGEPQTSQQGEYARCGLSLMDILTQVRLRQEGERHGLRERRPRQYNLNVIGVIVSRFNVRGQILKQQDTYRLVAQLILFVSSRLSFPNNRCGLRQLLP